MPLQWKQHSVTGKFVSISRRAYEANRFEGVIFVNPNRETQHNFFCTKYWCCLNAGPRICTIAASNSWPKQVSDLVVCAHVCAVEANATRSNSKRSGQSVVSISNEDVFLHLMTFVQPVFLNCCSIFSEKQSIHSISDEHILFVKGNMYNHGKIMSKTQESRSATQT